MTKILQRGKLARVQDSRGRVWGCALALVRRTTLGLVLSDLSNAVVHRYARKLSLRRCGVGGACEIDRISLL